MGKNAPLLQLIASMSILFFTSCQGSYQAPDEPIKEVAFTQVHCTDSFWAPRIEVNRTVSIPSAFHQCEINGRFDNFAVAAGLIKKEHQGDFPFDDTDPYKIIEGASYSLAVHYDAALDAYLDSVINLIARAQEPDGYLCTCVTNKCERLAGWWGSHRWEKINSHELYCCGHLYEAAVAHFKATGKRTLLDVALKNADLICKVFGPAEGQIHRPSGHPIVEMALCKLYKVTGEQRYLDLAKYFVEETGRGTDGHTLSAYSQDHMPILKQQEIVGHAVRAGYLYSGVADVASLTHDTAYFHALTRIWNDMAGRKLYITGGIGSRPQGEGFGPDYELHNHMNYCETCASIANVYWNYRMFLATGESKYMDVLELALYNGVLSGVSLSGDRFFYDNPLESNGEHSRQAWFGCACCPGNITRFIASVPGYLYATQGNDIFVNLFVAGTAHIATASDTVTLVQETSYPWDGKVKLTVNPIKSGKFAIRLRIPGWAKESPTGTDLYSYTAGTGKCTAQVNGKETKGSNNGEYLTLERNWKAGDVIEYNMPMETRRVVANEKVEDDLGRNALQRGPIVFCLEGVDQADKAVFNKYLPADAPIEAQYKPSLLGGVVTLTAQGKEIESNGSEKEVTLTAIPYSVWNNRGEGNMEVWIAQKAPYAVATPAPTIASRAKAFSLRGAIQNDALQSNEMDSVWGVNDLWEPKRSNDISKPYFYWWLRRGTPESILYSFDKPEKVSSVDVYWLDFDHYDGDFRVPASWKLYYLSSNRWKEVKAKGPYTVKKDQYNHLDFEGVTTTGLKITAQLQEGESGGVIEWKVNP